MKQNLPTRRMREHRDLEQLKRQAKELLQGFVAGEAEAIAEVNAHYRAANASEFALHDAQLIIARSYGFEESAQAQGICGRCDGQTVSRRHTDRRSGAGAGYAPGTAGTRRHDHACWRRASAHSLCGDAALGRDGAGDG